MNNQTLFSYITSAFGTNTPKQQLDKMNNYFNFIYVITLPKRVEYVKETFKKMRITYTHFNAIVVTQDTKRKLLETGRLARHNNLKNLGELGCSLSHLTIIENFYKQTTKENSSVFIFEDDIVLDTDYMKKLKTVMDNIPSDWDIINFSRCWADCGKDNMVGDLTGISRNALCASAYAVTRKGARKIIQNAYPITDPIDIYYTNLMKRNPNVINIGGHIDLKGEPLIMYSAIPRIFKQLKSLPTTSCKGACNCDDIKEVRKSALNNKDSCKECKYGVIKTYNRYT